MSNITENEIDEKIATLKTSLDERAQNLISSDPVCAEIRGNIAALEWRFRESESKDNE